MKKEIMKFLKPTILLFVIGSMFFGCFEDNDDNQIFASEISDFVWKGMNVFYLYKDEIPDLANDRFTSNEEYGNYLNGFGTPFDLFESIIYQRETVDRFSVLVDDYIALEQFFAGVSKSNGLRYFSLINPSNANERILLIRQVLKNSVAEGLNLQRGQFFNQIDGITITADNINSLLSEDTYTLHHADYNDNGTPETDDDTFVSNGTTTSLTKVEFTENPIHTASIIDVDGENLGYLMYNSFNNDFDNQLNAAFATFLSNNVQHLVIDLRYNGGGSVNTASLLGSMTTGQFTGQVFSKLEYNSDLQEFNSDFNFTNTLDGSVINSLNLDKVYVLTTSRTASASEMIINSLRAYIDVVQVGGTTVGKSQASITVYDSENFRREGANPNHTFALQPLVAISVNKNDDVVPASGIVPNIPLNESAFNLGQLGDVNEPFLAAVIADITGLGRSSQTLQNESFNLKNEDNKNRFKNEMYIENDLLLNRLQFNE